MGRLRHVGSPRARILCAAAALVCDKGYRACSITDVASAAGVSRRFFYNHFEDKRAAVVAAYEHCFERLVAVCAPAFFGSEAWEDRVWQAGGEFARFFAREPVLAHLAFGQTHALGPTFAKRVNDLHVAFTWFLDGRHYDPSNGGAIAEARSVLTAATVSELAFQSLRHGAALNMLAQLPLVTYVVLRPFVGREDASAFVDSKLQASRERLA
jgi:AcrR family transcriptional regulator